MRIAHARKNRKFWHFHKMTRSDENRLHSVLSLWSETRSQNVRAYENFTGSTSLVKHISFLNFERTLRGVCSVRDFLHFLLVSYFFCHCMTWIFWDHSKVRNFHSFQVFMYIALRTKKNLWFTVTYLDCFFSACYFNFTQLLYRVDYSYFKFKNFLLVLRLL